MGNCCSSEELEERQPLQPNEALIGAYRGPSRKKELHVERERGVDAAETRRNRRKERLSMLRIANARVPEAQSVTESFLQDAIESIQCQSLELGSTAKACVWKAEDGEVRFVLKNLATLAPFHTICICAESASEGLALYAKCNEASAPLNQLYDFTSSSFASGSDIFKTLLHIPPIALEEVDTLYVAISGQAAIGTRSFSLKAYAVSATCILDQPIYGKSIMMNPLFYRIETPFEGGFVHISLKIPVFKAVFLLVGLDRCPMALDGSDADQVVCVGEGATQECVVPLASTKHVWVTVVGPFVDPLPFTLTARHVWSSPLVSSTDGADLALSLGQTVCGWMGDKDVHFTLQTSSSDATLMILVESLVEADVWLRRGAAPSGQGKVSARSRAGSRSSTTSPRASWRLSTTALAPDHEFSCKVRSLTPSHSISAITVNPIQLEQLAAAPGPWHVLLKSPPYDARKMPFTITTMLEFVSLPLDTSLDSFVLLSTCKYYRVDVPSAGILHVRAHIRTPDQEARIFVKHGDCPPQRGPRLPQRDYDASSEEAVDQMQEVSLPVRPGAYYVSVEPKEDCYKIVYSISASWTPLEQPGQHDVVYAFSSADALETASLDIADAWSIVSVDVDRLDQTLLLSVQTDQAVEMWATHGGLPKGTAPEISGTSQHLQDGVLSSLILSPKQLTQEGKGLWYIGLRLATVPTSLSVHRTWVDTCNNLEPFSTLYGAIPARRWTYYVMEIDASSPETVYYTVSAKVPVLARMGAMPSLEHHDHTSDLEASDGWYRGSCPITEEMRAQGGSLYIGFGHVRDQHCALILQGGST